MTQPQFSLSWDEHMKNISSGLSLLQQNGEFVDMTLAADGYLVKVHQVIIALSSPFLKDLITSAQCPHPVIVLNKISHNTLSAILEYIYTGEVLVAVQDLNELIDAAKELHIKGLQEMNLSQALACEKPNSPAVFTTHMDDVEDVCYFEITNPPTDINISDTDEKRHGVFIKDEAGIGQNHKFKKQDMITLDELPSISQKHKKEPPPVSLMQYTVSNQGSIQLILNRFIYYLKHTNRDSSRQWRCVNYLNNSKCPAYIVTQNDVVVQRISAHNHPFHDSKILKKVKNGAIFTTVLDAEKEGTIRKNNKVNEEESE